MKAREALSDDTVDSWFHVKPGQSVCIDQCMLESRGLVNSCVNRNLQVATELNAVFDQVVPKGSVVSRGDGGEGDLRKYLSETVKVTLPPVPETGSGAGK